MIEQTGVSARSQRDSQAHRCAPWAVQGVGWCQKLRHFDLVDVGGLAAARRGARRPCLSLHTNAYCESHRHCLSLVNARAHQRGLLTRRPLPKGPLHVPSARQATIEPERISGSPGGLGPAAPAAVMKPPPAPARFTGTWLGASRIDPARHAQRGAHVSSRSSVELRTTKLQS